MGNLGGDLKNIEFPIFAALPVDHQDVHDIRRTIGAVGGPMTEPVATPMFVANSN